MKFNNLLRNYRKPVINKFGRYKKKEYYDSKEILNEIGAIILYGITGYVITYLIGVGFILMYREYDYQKWERLKNKSKESEENKNKI